MSNAKHSTLANSIYYSLNPGAAIQSPRLGWLGSTCPAAKDTTELRSSLFFKKAEAAQQREQ